ncbi:MAG: B3/4 domain-containing protein [Thermoplasmata archaeon]
MIALEKRLAAKYPNLKVVALTVNDVRVERTSPALEDLKEEVARDILERYDIEALKNDERIRKYRDFFWRLGTDPTKIRPASEALIRRVLQGRLIPRINTAVDAYNLASMMHNVAIGSFDLDRFTGQLLIRWASPEEEFLGIGMDKPKVLSGKEIVISDDEKLVAIYPYRDADATKVTTETKSIFSLMCGVPGIGKAVLREAAETTIAYITEFCGGTGKILCTH